MTDNYKKALQEAREELVKLLGQKEELDKRVAQLQQTVSGLSALCGEEPVERQSAVQAAILRNYEMVLEGITGKPGLTDAVRAALKAFNRPLTPVEVRDGLISLGYDLSIYGNVLASIHTILKRLVDNEEVKEVEKDGKKAYESQSLANVYIHKTYGWAKNESKPTIDPYSGKGGAASQPDFILANPPYATEEESDSGLKVRRTPAKKGGAFSKLALERLKETDKEKGKK
jgi:hypothetical protein